MAQVFPRWTNRIPLFAAVAGPVLLGLPVAAIWYYGSPRYTDVGYQPHQPVPYSHKLHVGELGLDCRYCHVSVERSAVANIPPTQVCMNCHHVIKRDSRLLEPIRESLAKDRPMRWVRVHNLPDYAYFHHAAHLAAGRVRAAGQAGEHASGDGWQAVGVGCVSCHGPIHQMEVVTQMEPLSMSWCLDCHRNPAPYLRPAAEVTNMEWIPPKDQLTRARQAILDEGVAPPQDCSWCHR